VHCRDHAVQLHRARERFGAPLVFIGMGSPRQAAAFHKRRKLEGALVLSDEDRASYRAAGTRRGSWAEVVGPASAAKGLLRAARSGQVQGRPVGDVRQLGGAMVIGRGGEVLFSRMAENAADNVAADEIVSALRSAGAGARGRPASPDPAAS
jgi:hypothetical protein